MPLSHGQQKVSEAAQEEDHEQKEKQKRMPPKAQAPRKASELPSKKLTADEILQRADRVASVLQQVELQELEIQTQLNEEAPRNPKAVLQKKLQQKEEKKKQLQEEWEELKKALAEVNDAPDPDGAPNGHDQKPSGQPKEGESQGASPSSKWTTLLDDSRDPLQQHDPYAGKKLPTGPDHFSGNAWKRFGSPEGGYAPFEIRGKGGRFKGTPGGPGKGKGAPSGPKAGKVLPWGPDGGQSATWDPEGGRDAPWSDGKWEDWGDQRERQWDQKWSSADGWQDWSQWDDGKKWQDDGQWVAERNDTSSWRPDEQQANVDAQPDLQEVKKDTKLLNNFQ